MGPSPLWRRQTQLFRGLEMAGWHSFPHTPFSVFLIRVSGTLGPLAKWPWAFLCVLTGSFFLTGGLSTLGPFWLWLTLFPKQGGTARPGICFSPLLTQQLNHFVVPPRWAPPSPRPLYPPGPYFLLTPDSRDSLISLSLMGGFLFLPGIPFFLLWEMLSHCSSPMQLPLPTPDCAFSVLP